ncbi:MAG: PaaI family thioesterase [Saprospirales bacterium]|nr:PaaI family thioesterase [Saprospirales bacterium]MBK7338082.1 PaaI family thioesterase [Saprospirales bacterium]
MDKVEDGLVQISSKFSDNLSQQHNFFHAGVITSIVYSACGYAALTLVPADKDVLTVEFKINFLKPGNTTRLIAVGEVIQSGMNTGFVLVGGQFTVSKAHQCQARNP